MSSSNSDPITCYSHTHRIVLLIDLDPLLQNNHHHYIKTILSTSKTLFSFPPLSSSLFAFKFFFSSLPPHISFSKLHPFLPKHSFSFDHPSSSFNLLSQILSSLPNFPLPYHPKASHLIDSITQLLHDYPWEPDSDAATLLVPPNLILLFTPLFNSFKSLAGFLESNEELLRIESSFCDKFLGFFGNVSRRFGSRGVHCSWIGVDSNRLNESGEDEVGVIRGLFEIGARKLGWGFCSLDSILLGSALVPFGLIYPKIGVSWFSVRCCSREVKVQLNLRILDVNGSPIDYNCCDLEVLDFRVLGRGEDVNLQGGGGIGRRKERLWNVCSDGMPKLKVMAVRKCGAFVKLNDCLSDSVLVREVLGESKKGDSGEFFADRVLELLASEFGCQGRRKSIPVWEILLCYLYKEDCWALVSVDSGKGGGSCVGILRPFTVSSALLSIVEDLQLASDFGAANMDSSIRTGISESDRKFDKNKGMLDSQVKSAVGIKGKQKKKMTDLNVLQNLTWSSFCDLVYDQFEMDLHEVYYAMECNKSKKLKFLKCWMKQVKKSSCCDLMLENPKPNRIIAEGSDSKLNELPQNGEQSISLVVVSNEINAEVAMKQDDAVLNCESETSEAFLSNLSSRIQQGVESNTIDLLALSERLVNSSIYWLCKKVDRETIPQIDSHMNDNKARGSVIASELIKLLLKDPKEIAAKHKSRNLFSQLSDAAGPATIITEHAVREYELQILFRMEILQSEVGCGIEDSSKQKFVKQICLLLENIQCHMEGGFFGDWNLENYVAKIIKSRYSHTLEDTVHKIYSKMDLLLFSNQDEAPDFLFNSEDSSKSLNLEVYGDEMGENDVINGPFSAENEAFHLQKNVKRKSQRNIDGGCDKKLFEAVERRERAHRFSYIKSRMPALRVWAPKQKCMKSKTDHLFKIPKRKDRSRVCYDTVCETPMTKNTRSSPQSISSDDNRYMADGSQVGGSVAKALFQVQEIKAINIASLMILEFKR
ncbi:uncharacterized protein LOC127075319 isoform X1 [Lathyrus oleraceus]|uniref:uncharacterized protein LOC127075319 isoform X1 n=1 Tax=Pisum sativum TaxID=3888 RepID=UPI0021D17AE5|nr:uncharacterized protein LOC127075319 isoform X1 [Pisum sativum]